MQKFVDEIKNDEDIREVVSKDISEFLTAPVVFIKNEFYEKYCEIKNEIPAHNYKPAEGNKQSFTLEFENIYDRDAARETLAKNGFRYRTGKTLVPFRISGNAE